MVSRRSSNSEFVLPFISSHSFSDKNSLSTVEAGVNKACGQQLKCHSAMTAGFILLYQKYKQDYSNKERITAQRSRDRGWGGVTCFGLTGMRSKKKKVGACSIGGLKAPIVQLNKIRWSKKTRLIYSVLRLWPLWPCCWNTKVMICIATHPWIMFAIQIPVDENEIMVAWWGHKLWLLWW